MLQRLCFVTGDFQLLLSRLELGLKKVFLLATVFDLALQLVDLVAKGIVFRLDDHVQIFLLKSFLLERLVPQPVRFVLFHHNVVIALQKLHHFVLLDPVAHVQVQEASILGVLPQVRGQ